MNGIFIFNIQEKSFRVKYDAVKGATSYKIRSNKEGDSPIFSTITNDTDVTISYGEPLINNYFVEVAYSVDSYMSKFSLPLQTSKSFNG